MRTDLESQITKRSQKLLCFQSYSHNGRLGRFKSAGMQSCYKGRLQTEPTIRRCRGPFAQPGTVTELLAASASNRTASTDSGLGPGASRRREFLRDNLGGAMTSGCGTFFKMTPGGTLYSFCSQTNCPDGAVPRGPELLLVLRASRWASDTLSRSEKQ